MSSGEESDGDGGWSDLGEDWDDEIPLSTYRALNQTFNINNMEVGNEAEEDDEDEIQMENLDPAPEGENIRKWDHMITGVRKSPPLPEFDNADTGVAPFTNLTSESNIVDFFRVFFTLEFVSILTRETNKYAAAVREAFPGQHKSKWVPVTTSDITKFLGLTYLMGLLKKPDIGEYWSTVKEISTPFFTTVMRRDRFKAIMRYINFPGLPASQRRPEAAPRGQGGTQPIGEPPTNVPVAGPSDEPQLAQVPTQTHPNAAPGQPSGVSKVRWLFDFFNTIARKVYIPKQDIAIDESMCKHKGRSIHRQYMPAKPTRYGFKVWVAAESLTGYVMQAIPFFSKRSEPAQKKSLSLYQSVVFPLLKSGRLLGKGHRLFCDNYYTTVHMFTDLASRFATYCCGTLRMNRRNLPKELMKKDLPHLKEKGSARFSVSKPLTLIIWRDTKLIHLLSTIHSAEMSTCSRLVKDTQSGQMKRAEIPCPLAVKDYSRCMGAVDLADQLYSYYSFQRKSAKWTKKFFFYLLELMKLNAYVMRNSLIAKKDNLYHFSLVMVQQLICQAQKEETIPPAMPRVLPLPPAKKVHPSRMTNRCFPVRMEKSLCVVCKARNKAGTLPSTHSTNFGCADCEKPHLVHLCPDPCFRYYHTKEHYHLLTGPGPSRPRKRARQEEAEQLREEVPMVIEEE